MSQPREAQMPIHFLDGLLGKSCDAKAGQHKNRPVSKCCFSCVVLHIFHSFCIRGYVCEKKEPSESHVTEQCKKERQITSPFRRFFPFDFPFLSGSSYLRHVGDEKGQPGAEEQPQEDSQGQTGLQCPPPVPVGQATLTVHRWLRTVKSNGRSWNFSSNIYLVF